MIHEILVTHRGLALATLDASRLERLAEVLEVDGIEIPWELDGLTATVETPRQVRIAYRVGEDTLRLVQSRPPRVDLPQSVDLERLGRIGLRLTGMSEEEAAMFARTIDWGSTLLIPVPLDGATFRKVDVKESEGLLVTSLARTDHGRGRWRSLLLWAEDDRVFALEGRGQGLQVVRLANSME